MEKQFLVPKVALIPGTEFCVEILHDCIFIAICTVSVYTEYASLHRTLNRSATNPLRCNDAYAVYMLTIHIAVEIQLCHTSTQNPVPGLYIKINMFLFKDCFEMI